MIFGYLRRRKAEKAELETLRSFQDEMCHILDNLELLMQLDEEEEHAVTLADLWQPEYRKLPQCSEARMGMRVPILKNPVPFPEPTSSVDSYRVMEHNMLAFNHRMLISDQELLLRRSSSEYAELAARVSRELERAVTQTLVDMVDPFTRKKALDTR